MSQNKPIIWNRLFKQQRNNSIKSLLKSRYIENILRKINLKSFAYPRFVKKHRQNEIWEYSGWIFIENILQIIPYLFVFFWNLNFLKYSQNLCLSQICGPSKISILITSCWFVMFWTMISPAGCRHRLKTFGFCWVKPSLGVRIPWSKPQLCNVQLIWSSNPKSCLLFGGLNLWFAVIPVNFHKFLKIVIEIFLGLKSILVLDTLKDIKQLTLSWYFF